MLKIIFQICFAMFLVSIVLRFSGNWNIANLLLNTFGVGFYAIGIYYIVKKLFLKKKVSNVFQEYLDQNKVGPYSVNFAQNILENEQTIFHSFLSSGAIERLVKLKDGRLILGSKYENKIYSCLVSPHFNSSTGAWILVEAMYSSEGNDLDVELENLRLAFEN